MAKPTAHAPVSQVEIPVTPAVLNPPATAPPSLWERFQRWWWKERHATPAALSSSGAADTRQQRGKKHKEEAEARAQTRGLFSTAKASRERIAIELPNREASLVFYIGKEINAATINSKDSPHLLLAIGADKIDSYYDPANHVGALVSHRGIGHADLEELLPASAIAYGGTRYIRQTKKPEDSVHFGYGTEIQQRYFRVRYQGESFDP